MFDNIFLNLNTTYLDNAVYLLCHLKYILHDKVSIASILGGGKSFLFAEQLGMASNPDNLHDV